MNTTALLVLLAVTCLIGATAVLVRYYRTGESVDDDDDDPLNVGSPSADSDSVYESDGHDETDRSLFERIRARVSRRSSDGKKDDNNTKPLLPRVVEVLTSFRAKAFYFFFIVFAVAISTLYVSYQLAGLISTIVYAFLFFFTLTFLAVMITVLGSATPGKRSLGKGHIILGAFAFGHHYLVQRDDRWEWCPGTEDQIWIDNKWHQIKGGLENKSVLGWRPFGITRYKEDDGAFLHERVDEEAERKRSPDKSVTGPRADGGAAKTEVVNNGEDSEYVENAVEMGGYEIKEKPEVAGYNGRWQLDVRRIMTEGVKKIGDVELVERAEEIIERGQVDDSRIGNHKPMITFVASLIFGVLTGFIYIYIGV